MAEMTADERRTLFKYLDGNVEAVRLCEDIIAVAHFWDDAVDRDILITDAAVNQAMWKALFTIHENPFMRRHFERLMPIMKSAARSWMTATEWEREEGACIEKMVTAFAIRSDYLKVVSECAAIIRGDWVATEGETILREIFHVEGVHAYLKSVRVERENRESANVRR